MLFLSMIFFNYKVYEWIILLIILIPQAVIDYRRKVVYILPNITLVIVFQTFITKGNVSDRLMAIIPGLIIIVLSLVFKESIGTGDGLVFLTVGSLIGLSYTVRLMAISFLISGVFGIVYLLIKKGSRKEKLPFVPFILAGTLLNGII